MVKMYLLAAGSDYACLEVSNLFLLRKREQVSTWTTLAR